MISTKMHFGKGGVITTSEIVWPSHPYYELFTLLAKLGIKSAARHL